MQITPTSARISPAQQQYNFKVKVNYQNGQVTVHGPRSPSLPSGSMLPPPPIVPVQSPIGHYHQPQPFPLALWQTPRMMPQIAMTAPPALPSILDMQKRMKTSSDQLTVESLASSEDLRIRKAEISSTNGNMGFNTNGIMKGNVLMEKQIQQEIDCVICEKKFKPQDFQYHLELHRNPRRKTQQVHSSNKQFDFREEVSKSQMSMKDLQSQNNSFQNQNRAEMLYSFNKQQSIGQNSLHQDSQSRLQPQIFSIHTSNQSSFLQGSPQSSINQSLTLNPFPQPHQLIQPQFPLQTQHPSVAFQPEPSQQIQQILNQSIQSRNSQRLSQGSNANNGIRYLDRNFKMEPLRQSFGINTSIPHAINSSVNSHPASVQNSRLLVLDQSIHSSRNSFQSSQKGPEQPRVVPSTPQLSTINPFKQIVQQQQSQIFDYFPLNENEKPQPYHKSFPHYSNQQDHGLNFNKNNRFVVVENAQERKRLQNIQQLPPNNEENLLNLSRSSVSSIKSLKQPLEDMSRDRIIQYYQNKNKNRINLANIVGMSEALARQGFSSSQSQSKSIKNFNNLSQQNRQSLKSKNLKFAIAKSMYIPEPHSDSFAQHQIQAPSSNLSVQMLPIKNKQVYRGTQIQENDFQAMDSILNMTQSSKSSLKSKLPRNYLAVNDFITSSRVLTNSQIK